MPAPSHVPLPFAVLHAVPLASGTSSQESTSQTHLTQAVLGGIGPQRESASDASLASVSAGVAAQPAPSARTKTKHPE
jgi:hypothetical protein